MISLVLWCYLLTVNQSRMLRFSNVVSWIVDELVMENSWLMDFDMLDKRQCQLLTASQDFTVKWWSVNKVHKTQSSLMAARKDSLLGEFGVHQSAVESVTVSPGEDKVCDFDECTILIF